MSYLRVRTDTTIPTGANIELKVYEDSTGDGTADNTHTFTSIRNGSWQRSIEGFDCSPENQVWFRADLTNSTLTSNVVITGSSVTISAENTFLQHLIDHQPRPAVDFSYPKTTAEFDIPQSNTNKVQFLGSSGREIKFSGEVSTDSDVRHLLEEVQNSKVQYIDVPELQEVIRVMPIDLSITEEVGQQNRHHYELSVKESA